VLLIYIALSGGGAFVITSIAPPAHAAAQERRGTVVGPWCIVALGSFSASAGFLSCRRSLFLASPVETDHANGNAVIPMVGFLQIGLVLTLVPGAGLADLCVGMVSGAGLGRPQSSGLMGSGCVKTKPGSDVFGSA